MEKEKILVIDDDPKSTNPFKNGCRVTGWRSFTQYPQRKS